MWKLSVVYPEFVLAGVGLPWDSFLWSSRWVGIASFGPFHWSIGVFMEWATGGVCDWVP